MGKERIPVAAPALLGNEKAYVGECLDSTWISSIGEFISRFERGFADYCGVAHGISCSNGTTALHLALLGLGIGPGDEVLVPSLTYVATANAVRYCGADPVFVDSDVRSWNLDPADMARKITPRTRAVIPVHLYGRAAAMAEVRSIAAQAGLWVVEDAAEAVGARYDGKVVGSLGHVAAFSFFGNKILTCGEGGMVVTNDADLARRIRQLKGQGQDFERRYWFPIVGYNYRMTNVAAAIGLAQLERIDDYLTHRDQIDSWYREELSGLPAVTMPPRSSHRDVCWLFSVVLEEDGVGGRDRVIAELDQVGIETRPFFYPCHTLPPYARPDGDQDCPRAEWLAARGLSLPTWVGMTREHVERVGTALRKAVRSLGRLSPLP